MAMPIMEVTSVKAVAAKKSPSRGSSHIRERTIIYEGSSGPRELLEAIVIQAQAALKGLEPLKLDAASEEEMTEEQKRQTDDDKGKGKDTGKGTTADENLKLLGFCRRIVSTARGIDRSLRETKGDAFVERLHASLPRIPGTSSGSGRPASEVRVSAGQTEEEARKTYMDWANRVRFEYCDLTVPSNSTDPDDTPHFKFYFNNEARMLANSDIPKRSLAIAKEVSIVEDLIRCGRFVDSL